MTSWGSGWAREFFLLFLQSIKYPTWVFWSLAWCSFEQSRYRLNVVIPSFLFFKVYFFLCTSFKNSTFIHVYSTYKNYTCRHIKWKMWDKVVAKQSICREFWPTKKLLSLVSLPTERSRLSPLSHFPLTFHPPQSGFLFSTATTFKLPNPV